MRLELHCGDELLGVWAIDSRQLSLRIFEGEDLRTEMKLNNPPLGRQAEETLTIEEDSFGLSESLSYTPLSSKWTRTEGDDFTMPGPLGDTSSKTAVLFPSISYTDEMPEGYPKSLNPVSNDDRTLDSFKNIPPVEIVPERSMEIWRFRKSRWDHAGRLELGATVQGFSVSIKLCISGELMVSGRSDVEVFQLHHDERQERIELKNGPVMLPIGTTILILGKGQALCVRPISSTS